MQKARKRPLLVAADLKRPAAIDQLEVLGEQIGVPVYTERDHQNAVKVCRNGIKQARATDRDVIILDTAGRSGDRRRVDDRAGQDRAGLHSRTRSTWYSTQ
jgi:signal recognition particle subunit SRP54